MNYIDIHSHILPGVDDGAKDTETSLALLEMLKEQGITAVMATPHFYPDTDSAEDFFEKVNNAFNGLKAAVSGKNLPEIYLGCELHYFNGIGKSSSIKRFCLNNTNYVLLELSYGEPITKTVLQDIIDINEQQGLTPVLAHIERYGKVKGYKKLLKLIENGYALAHVNADGVISKEESKCCEKLIKGGYASFIASDTHSPHRRPPKFDEAFKRIELRLGKSDVRRLLINANRFSEELFGINE